MGRKITFNTTRLVEVEVEVTCEINMDLFRKWVAETGLIGDDVQSEIDFPITDSLGQTYSENELLQDFLEEDCFVEVYADDTVDMRYEDESILVSEDVQCKETGAEESTYLHEPEICDAVFADQENK